MEARSVREGIHMASNGKVRRQHELVDVTEPNLLREIFPYDAVPRIVFDGVIETPEPAPDFFITDTTFRDGQQARPPYTVEQIVAMFDMLHRLGGPNGIIRQTEFFVYSKTDRDAVNRCLARGYEFPEVTGWIRAVKSDFKIVQEMGLRETGILTSCSDYHIFLKLGKTRRQAMDDYLAIVNAALDAGLSIRCHLEDATRADFYGFVAPFVSKLMDLSAQSKIPVKIRVCDTLGYGERTGNPPLEGLVMDYVALKGSTNGMDLSVITEIAEYFEREIGYKIPANYPLVGRDFNVTRAGIHADGLLKDEEIYNVFDTAQILRRPPRVAVDKTSGAAGIAWWINAYFTLPRDRQVEKRSPEVSEIAKWVDAQYDDGRTTSISDEEMAAQARQHLPRLFERAQSERLAG